MEKWGNVNKSHSGRFRHIHAYSGIFRHIQTYPDVIRHIWAYLGITQAYSEPCVTLAVSELWYLPNSGIKPEAYLEPWYIQNSGTFRTRDIFRILGY